MMAQILLTIRVLILGLSGLGLGASAYLAVTNLVSFARTHRRSDLAYGMTRFGTVMVVFVLTKVVYRVPSVPWTTDVTIYTIGLATLAFGLLGIIDDHRRHGGGGIG